MLKAFIPCLALLASCSMFSPSVERATTYQALKQAEIEANADVAQAEAEVAAAGMTPDMDDDTAAETELYRAQGRLQHVLDEFAEFEEQVTRENLGVLGQAATLIPGVGPGANMLIEAVSASGLLSLTSKRRRQHLGNAVKMAAKGKLPTAAKSVAKAYGYAHTEAPGA